MPRNSSDRPAFPLWLWIPAAVGLGFLMLPLAGLIAQLDWQGVWPALFNSDSLSALRLSAQTACASTVVSMCLGVPLAFGLSRTRFPGRSVVRTLVLLPLVLPPVVGGVALLYTFGRVGLVGQGLEQSGISVAFTTTAVVLAQSFVAMPFVVLTVEGALSSADGQLERVAAGLGASPGRTFFLVTIPSIAPALASSAVLAFARALGEFGATVTFAGSLKGTTRTMPLEIYLQNEAGNPQNAIALSLLLVLIAFVIVLSCYRPQGRSTRAPAGDRHG